MAPDKTTVAGDDRDDLAFQLFAARAAVLPPGRAGERHAEDAYRAADAFLRVKARAGALVAEKPAGPRLADASCPNQKPTHPLNLVSQRFGDLARVNRIKQWLDRNPTPEREPEELTARLNREFGLDWDTPQVGLARQVFPAYCPASKN